MTQKGLYNETLYMSGGKVIGKLKSLSKNLNMKMFRVVGRKEEAREGIALTTSDLRPFSSFRRGVTRRKVTDKQGEKVFFSFFLHVWLW